MATTLRAFHGGPAVKARYQARLEQHRERDQIIRDDCIQIIRDSCVRGDLENGTFRGGALACTVHTEDPVAYERELGIPKILASLEDEIFETLPADYAHQFAVDFLAAIAVGADLSLVAPQFVHWILMDDRDGVIRFAETEEVETAIRGVGDLFSHFLSGKVVKPKQWRNAGAAALAAASAIRQPDTIAEFAASRPADRINAAAAKTAVDAVSGAAAAARSAANAEAIAATAAEAIAAAGVYDKTPASASAMQGAYHKTYKSVWEAARTKQAAKLLQLLREAPVAA